MAKSTPGNMQICSFSICLRRENLNTFTNQWLEKTNVYIEAYLQFARVGLALERPLAPQRCVRTVRGRAERARPPGVCGLRASGVLRLTVSEESVFCTRSAGCSSLMDSLIIQRVCRARAIQQIAGLCVSQPVSQAEQANEREVYSSARDSCKWIKVTRSSAGVWLMAAAAPARPPRARPCSLLRHVDYCQINKQSAL